MTQQEYDAFYTTHEKQLNLEQRDFINKVAVVAGIRMEERLGERNTDPKLQRMHHLCGDGGVGKTFVFNVSHKIIIS